MDSKELIINHHKYGLTIKVVVHPQASQNRIESVYNGMLKIDVTSPPEKGKANNAIIKLLAEKLGFAKSSIEIMMGKSLREKVILIKGLTIEDLQEKLKSIIPNR